MTDFTFRLVNKMGRLRVANIFASCTSCENIQLHPTGTESKKFKFLTIPTPMSRQILLRIKLLWLKIHSIMFSVFRLFASGG